MIGLLQAGTLDPIMTIAEEYDAFEDNPWFVIYRELDARFPASKFILTVRDESRWIESAVRYYGRSQSNLRRWIYGAGTPIGHEARWRERYRQHNEQVAARFGGRPGSLLIVDWEQGHGWPELCAFLDRPCPDGPFPRLRPAARS